MQHFVFLRQDEHKLHEEERGRATERRGRERQTEEIRRLHLRSKIGASRQITSLNKVFITVWQRGPHSSNMITCPC